MQTVFDPLRKKAVPLTAEEHVRQWFISVLLNDAKVPSGRVNSEVGFRYGEKQYRADILVWDAAARPLLVVECKAPEVEIGSAVLDQAARYNMVLDLKWIVLTNGRTTVVLKKQANQFVPQDKLPSYDQML